MAHLLQLGLHLTTFWCSIPVMKQLLECLTQLKPTQISTCMHNMLDPAMQFLPRNLLFLILDFHFAVWPSQKSFCWSPWNTTSVKPSPNLQTTLQWMSRWLTVHENGENLWLLGLWLCQSVLSQWVRVNEAMKYFIECRRNSTLSVSFPPVQTCLLVSNSSLSSHSFTPKHTHEINWLFNFVPTTRRRTPSPWVTQRPQQSFPLWNLPSPKPEQISYSFNTCMPTSKKNGLTYQNQANFRGSREQRVSKENCSVASSLSLNYLPSQLVTVSSVAKKKEIILNPLLDYSPLIYSLMTRRVVKGVLQSIYDHLWHNWALIGVK